MHRTDGQVGSAETRAAKLRGILESAVIAIVTIGAVPIVVGIW